jgi:hypothetical protein
MTSDESFAELLEPIESSFEAVKTLVELQDVSAPVSI